MMFVHQVAAMKRKYNIFHKCSIIFFHKFDQRVRGSDPLIIRKIPFFFIMKAFLSQINGTFNSICYEAITLTFKLPNLAYSFSLAMHMHNALSLLKNVISLLCWSPLWPGLGATCCHWMAPPGAGWRCPAFQIPLC